MIRTLFALCAVALVLACAPATSLAQGTQRERAEAYRRAFVEGLEALSARRLDEAERAFKACVEIFPQQPVAHYNLACTYSQAGKEAQAVTELRECFRLGFKDLTHMARDVDLDPLRRSALFRKALSDFEAELRADLAPPLLREPEGEGRYPVLVFVPDPGDDAEQRLRELAPAFAELGLVVPVGVARDPRADDSSGEWRLVTVVREALAAHPRADRDRVYLVGEGNAGALALTAAVQHPDLFAGVLAAGPGLDAAVTDVDLSGARAYLVVNAEDPAEVAGGESARDAFAEAGGHVVLERYPLGRPFSRDRALLLRGLGWLRGLTVRLPGAGELKDF
ncbi:MAG: hypothetical protein D6731_09880 [Planctomycetota bacterium]|nr:MAG: hypothetical protein D6731_09880 [Planctomycetota bacterium]